MKKIKPERDIYGRVVQPARLRLTGRGASSSSSPGSDSTLEVDRRWLQKLKLSDHVTLRDARGRHRLIRIVRRGRDAVWGELRRTAYVTQGMRLERRTRTDRKCATTTISGVAPKAGVIRLQRDEILILTRRQVAGDPTLKDPGGQARRPARVSCSVPQVFGAVKVGERILLDDGRIRGVAESVGRGEIRIRVHHTAVRGGRLKSDKGINFPDTELRLPALTRKDLQDLRFILRHADMVGLSFANRAADVHRLLRHMRSRGKRIPALILKIETRSGFEHLPEILLTAMRQGRVAAMVARGDLAAEVGYERLAEIQEEILWICEAAHCPTVWATQVLESLAKDGIPSRAEITDAAMGIAPNA